MQRTKGGRVLLRVDVRAIFASFNRFYGPWPLIGNPLCGLRAVAIVLPMWTYEQARGYLVAALRHEAGAQEQGRPEQVGSAFDEFDANLPREGGPEFDKLHIALNFWDGWIDARNHDWQYYKPIRQQDWLRLARSIAAQVEADEQVMEPLVLERFDFRKHRKDTAT